MTSAPGSPRVFPSGHERNPGTDRFRGALALAVILGHYWELTNSDGFFKWMGAGIRMPLFFGLSGYLFSVERARTMRLIAFCAQKFHRLILPWLVGCTIYLTVTDQLTLLSPISIILHPPFHLWFVPVLIAFMTIATTSRASPTVMLALAAPASIAAMYLLGVAHDTGYDNFWLPDRRYFTFPIYYFFGLWVARRDEDPVQAPALTVALIGFLWWCALYFIRDNVPEVAAELITSLPLIYLLPKIGRIKAEIPILGDIGRNSLFFYLWHPMIFGLCLSAGLGGGLLLLTALLVLLCLRLVLASNPAIAKILGIASGGPSNPIAVFVPAHEPAQ